MGDDPTKTDGNADTVTAPVEATVEQPTQPVGDNTGLVGRVHGLTAEKGKLAKQVEALTKQNEDLKAKAMTEQEAAIEAAKQEALEPFKQRLDNIEATLGAQLESKLEGMTTEQKALIPEGLTVEQRLVQADKVLTMTATPATTKVGGPVAPQATEAVTFTREQFEAWQLLAGSPLLADKAKWAEQKDAMKAAFLGGRVTGYKAT